MSRWSGPSLADARRDVVVLGSTGSVGTQALDVIARNPERFRVVGIGAAASTPSPSQLLAEQARRFGVDVVAVGRAQAARTSRTRCTPPPPRPAGRPAARAAQGAGRSAGGDRAGRLAVRTSCSTRMPGSAGLAPTLAALDAGRTLALANKESLIVGGPLVRARSRAGQVVPVDSEHSALAQCLRGGRADEVRRLVLTASGGPFRGRTRAELADVTPAQALAHPTWSMGPLVTVNSATLVNKGLEVVEAHLLFDVPLDRIDVVVHPQSVVHSMVEFLDGSTLMQASPPDMRLPISLALGWPDRVPADGYGCDWTRAASLDFEPLDEEAFPAVRLARAAGAAGRAAPAGLQRRQRGGGGGVPRRERAVPRDRRHGGVRPGRAPRVGDRIDRSLLRARPDPGGRPGGRRVGAGPRPRAPGGGRVSGLGWVGVIAFAVGLLASVMIHEWGHFVTARRFGCKVTEFFVGFGTRLWSLRRGETEYGIKAIPAGGYVKIVGMTDLEPVAEEDKPRAFYSKPAWQRAVTLCAGSFMHLVLGLVLFYVAFAVFGQMQSDDRAVLGSVAPCVTSSGHGGLRGRRAAVARGRRRAAGGGPGRQRRRAPGRVVGGPDDPDPVQARAAGLDGDPRATASCRRWWCTRSPPSVRTRSTRASR